MNRSTHVFFYRARGCTQPAQTLTGADLAECSEGGTCSREAVVKWYDRVLSWQSLSQICLTLVAVPQDFDKATIFLPECPPQPYRHFFYRPR